MCLCVIETEKLKECEHHHVGLESESREGKWGLLTPFSQEQNTMKETESIGQGTQLETTMERDELQREPEASLSGGSYGKNRAHQKPRYPGDWAMAITGSREAG